MKLLGQKVLITGATGFIGNHLCNRIIKEGGELHAISRNKQTNKKHITWYQLDLTQFQKLKKLLKKIGPNIIFHLASHVSGVRDLALVRPTFHNNLLTTVNLLTAAAEIECDRIVLSGSMEEALAFDSSNVPCSPYAAAKVACSSYARMFHNLYNLPVTILRIFMVYGPAQKDLNKLIPYIIVNTLKDTIPELTNGKRMVDWIYVDDVVESFIAAALKSRVIGQTIDVGSGELIQIRTIVERIVKMINPRIKPIFGAIPERPFETSFAANLTNGYYLMNWKPNINLDEGLLKTINWYKNKI